MLNITHIFSCNILLICFTTKHDSYISLQCITRIFQCKILFNYFIARHYVYSSLQTNTCISLQSINFYYLFYCKVLIISFIQLQSSIHIFHDKVFYLQLSLHVLLTYCIAKYYSNVSQQSTTHTFNCKELLFYFNVRFYSCISLQSITHLFPTPYITDGPRSVVVTSADGFPFDTNGTRAMTLTCNVSGSNPSPNISWIWLSNYTVIGNGQSLTFKPQPRIDDDAVVMCVGTNVVTNYSLSRNITLDLNCKHPHFTSYKRGS